MRIAHVATDEVNQAFAVQMAAKCGAIIYHGCNRSRYKEAIYPTHGPRR